MKILNQYESFSIFYINFQFIISSIVNFSCKLYSDGYFQLNYFYKYLKYSLFSVEKRIILKFVKSQVKESPYEKVFLSDLKRNEIIIFCPDTFIKT